MKDFLFENKTPQCETNVLFTAFACSNFDFRTHIFKFIIICKSKLVVKVYHTRAKFKVKKEGGDGYGRTCTLFR